MIQPLLFGIWIESLAKPMTPPIDQSRVPDSLCSVSFDAKRIHHVDYRSC